MNVGPNRVSSMQLLHLHYTTSAEISQIATDLVLTYNVPFEGDSTSVCTHSVSMGSQYAFGLAQNVLSPWTGGVEGNAILRL